MGFSSKQIRFSVQVLLLLSGLVAIDAGSAVQMQAPGLVGTTMAAPTEEVVVAPHKTAKSSNHRCAVWASCNGVRQDVQLNHKKALLLAVAVGLNQNS